MSTIAEVAARLRSAASSPPGTDVILDAVQRASASAERELQRATGERGWFRVSAGDRGLRIDVRRRRVRSTRAGRAVVVSPTDVLHRHLDREMPAARNALLAAARRQLTGGR